MSDLIDRQAAIDTAVTFVRRTLLDSKPIDVKMSSDYIFVNLVEPMRKLPSVQPETNCSEFPNNSDTISRQAAIDALGEEPPVWYDGEDEIAERNQWRRDVNAIKAVPSAQPEYRPVNAEDFSKTMSENTVFSFWEWHGKVLELMEHEGFVICKRTM